MTDAANVDIWRQQATGKPMTIDDSSLVEQCRQGDSGAIERLVLKYQNRIYNVILKICADPDDAAELTQETFVKIIENLAKFEGRSSFYTWAFRIAVNLTLNYCQRNAKLAVRSLDSEEASRDHQATQALKELLSDDSAPDPAAIAQNKEVYEIAIQAIRQLDEPQRAVIILRDIEGMSYARIAEVLDVELGTVRSRLSRARNRLREILEAILS
ncbi:MAG: sigma-70 family RNA polymerase sigma factor [Sedimentisphaerales bacterium]|nr:sigma-70 family RNA polymerase sigma factor [Sedimentisphaerales bacterium]